MTNPNTLLGVGLGGSVIVALCCFTPILVIAFGALGLAAYTGYLDLVLLPLLAAFIALTVYAVIRRVQAARSRGADHE